MSALGAEMARLTRGVVEAHDTWDSPHQFVVFAVEGDRVAPRLVAVIDPAMHPDEYPATMLRLAAGDMTENGPACGWLLQTESYAVTELPASASQAEREQFDRDRRGRTFHQRADAVECCCAWAVTPDGSGWAVMKRRPDGSISESSWRPGSAPAGQMIRALLAIARVSAAIADGAP